MAQIDKENSIIDSRIFQISEDVSPNVSKQTEKRICEIKMEVEEHSIKQESLDGAIVDNNFFDILIKHDKNLGTTLMGNVYIKEERADGAIRKELYIKLERMDLLKLESRTHKNRYRLDSL